MKKVFLSLLLVPVLISCSSTPKQKSNLTFGMVKKHLIKGETGQEEVLRIFGAPNIITKRPGKQETWVYEKVAYEASSSGGFLGIGGGGQVSSSGGVGIGGAVSGSKSESGTRTVTLMIYFDENDTVSDYSIMETHY